jgi:hypothetical protein
MSTLIEVSWEQEIAALLSELSQVQDDLLVLLAQKAQWLQAGDLTQLAHSQPLEEQLLARLRHCHDRRMELLSQARQAGLPGASLAALAEAIPSQAPRAAWQRQFREAAHRARLLRHRSLANWVVAQRTLLHLTQLLEILATGGRDQPTYSKDCSAPTTGGLVDHEA